MKHKRKNADPVERLRRALSEASEALKDIEKEKATTESQPPGPGQPPPPPPDED